jgi:hypothetical protein
VPANDIAGTIVRVGPGTTGAGMYPFEQGDRVFGMSERFQKCSGGLQNYAILQANHAAMIPDNITTKEAATLPVNSVQAFMTLFDCSGFGSSFSFPPPFPDNQDFATRNFQPKSLVIAAPLSDYVRMLLQFGKLAGFRERIFVGDTSIPETVGQLKRLGATQVWDSGLGPKTIRDLIRLRTKHTFVSIIDFEHDDLRIPAEWIEHDLSPRKILTQPQCDSQGPLDLLGTNCNFPPRILHAEFTEAIPKAISQTFWDMMSKWVEDKRIRPLDGDIVELSVPTKIPWSSGKLVQEIHKILDQFRAGEDVKKRLICPQWDGIKSSKQG